MTVSSLISNNKGHDLSSSPEQKDEATQVLLINEEEEGKWSWSSELYGPSYYFEGENKIILPIGTIDIGTTPGQEEKISEQLTVLKKELKREIKKEKHADTPEDRIEAAKTIVELKKKEHELIQAKFDKEAEQESRKITEEYQEELEKKKARIQEKCNAALEKVDKEINKRAIFV